MRLPGGGGAPEIAASCRETLVMLEHTPRAFVERLDFVTTVGYGDGPGARERYGLRGRGVTAVITDLCILEPDAATCELTLTALHPGVSAEDVRGATGWPLRVAERVEVGAAAERGRARSPPRPEDLRRGGRRMSGVRLIRVDDSDRGGRDPRYLSPDYRSTRAAGPGEAARPRCPTRLPT